MGWERRKGQLYYYRKERTSSGRVRSRYMGRGARAIEASRADGVPVPDELLGGAYPMSEPVLETPYAHPSEMRGAGPVPSAADRPALNSEPVAQPERASAEAEFDKVRSKKGARHPRLVDRLRAHRSKRGLAELGRKG